jgi:hypothetical protein
MQRAVYTVPLYRNHLLLCVAGPVYDTMYLVSDDLINKFVAARSEYL